MGGDNHIDDIVSGINQYYNENKMDQFLLHGNKKEIEPILRNFYELKKNCKFIHTEKSIGMEEKPAQTIRSGRKSSMWNAIESVKKSKANVIV